jgi:FAD/FMN-containing dehydrogenase
MKTGRSLGRGILFCGRWAGADEAPPRMPRPRRRLRVPVSLPSGLLNRFTIGRFNAVVYRSHVRRQTRGYVSPEAFFYPLDRVEQWNLLYGARGVTQHQCVIPDEAGVAGVRRVIELLAEMGAASFLTVIKDCGAEGEGMLSFPRPGMSVALDLPIRDNTQQVIDRLNELVIAEGGRVYLTKDGFTRPDHFRAMEPRLAGFQELRRQWDPQGRLESAQSVRLFGGPE